MEQKLPDPVILTDEELEKIRKEVCEINNFKKNRQKNIISFDPVIIAHKVEIIEKRLNKIDEEIKKLSRRQT